MRDAVDPFHGQIVLPSMGTWSHGEQKGCQSTREEEHCSTASPSSGPRMVGGRREGKGTGRGLVGTGSCTHIQPWNTILCTPGPSEHLGTRTWTPSWTYCAGVTAQVGTLEHRGLGNRKYMPEYLPQHWRMPRWIPGYRNTGVLGYLGTHLGTWWAIAYLRSNKGTERLRPPTGAELFCAHTHRQAQNPPTRMVLCNGSQGPTTTFFSHSPRAPLSSHCGPGGPLSAEVTRYLLRLLSPTRSNMGPSTQAIRQHT